MTSLKIFLMTEIVIVDADAVIVTNVEATVMTDSTVTKDVMRTKEMTVIVIVVVATAIVDVTTTGEDSLALAGRRDFAFSPFLYLKISCI